MMKIKYFITCHLKKIFTLFISKKMSAWILEAVVSRVLVFALIIMHCQSFSMETPQSIIRVLQQGQWLTSQDMKDALFHIVQPTYIMGHSTGTDKFLSAQEYHSQMVFFWFKFNKFNIFQGHDVIAVINIPNLKCLT